ncbi:hypothetical protein AB0B10_08305 [Micromonospora arborensis]|uniref:hypothetical protein n=1 Tax=Micromonospora arborensis TaxID=2116518 RepID=UPI0033E198CA
MIAALAAAAVGLLSAFLPFTPAEPYLIAAVATTDAPPVALAWPPPPVRQPARS